MSMLHIVDQLVGAHFPSRVWTKGANGLWSSHEPTIKEKQARREWVKKHYRILAEEQPNE